MGPFILLELEPIVYLEKKILREKKVSRISKRTLVGWPSEGRNPCGTSGILRADFERISKAVGGIDVLFMEVYLVVCAWVCVEKVCTLDIIHVFHQNW